MNNTEMDNGNMMSVPHLCYIGFAFLPSFKLYSPQRKQIVILKHAGFNTFLLKRVLAFPGEVVEIRNGVLYVNGSAVDEPYVKNPCDWNFARHEVPKGKIFVLEVLPEGGLFAGTSAGGAAVFRR